MNTKVMYRFFLFCLTLCVSVCVTACGENHQEQKGVEISNKSTAEPDTVPNIPNPFPIVHYEKKKIKNAAELAKIRSLYGKTKETWDGYRAITTINRKDIHYFRVGDTIIIPDTVDKDTRIYSCFPHYYHGARKLDKIIIVSNKLQAYACYEKGHLVRFAAANTGTQRKPTFPGRYALNWKQRVRKSSLNEQWVLPYTWNFHAWAGSAFHQFDMPGRPVSHSCVRQFMEDAEWLFKWGKGGKQDSNRRWVMFVGTPVIILDMFDYKRKFGGPWREILTNRDGILQLPEKPMEVEEALIPLSQIPRDVRGSLVNRKRYLTAEDTLRARGIIDSTVTLRESIDYNKLRKLKEKKKLQEQLQKNSSNSGNIPTQ